MVSHKSGKLSDQAIRWALDLKEQGRFTPSQIAQIVGAIDSTHLSLVLKNYNHRMSKVFIPLLSSFLLLFPPNYLLVLLLYFPFPFLFPLQYQYQQLSQEERLESHKDQLVRHKEELERKKEELEREKASLQIALEHTLKGNLFLCLLFLFYF